MINININFDSLFFPLSIDRKAYKDPSYFSIADRFFAFAEKYKFKYTIFIIGRDLENEEVFAKVREWSNAGHEIGNHSYTHNVNLGSLSKAEIEYEVMKSHEIIQKCTGIEPTGFICPNWSTSPQVNEILFKNNYLYDISTFPSYFLYLILLKLKFLAKGNENHEISFRKRRDKLSALLAPRKPFFDKNGLLIMPAPTATLFRIPCWHTMGFVFGKKILHWLIKKALKDDKFYYYVTHPKDLADFSDLSVEFINRYAKELTFESLSVPLAQKSARFENAIRAIAKSGRKFATLKEIAGKFINEKKNNDSDGHPA